MGNLISWIAWRFILLALLLMSLMAAFFYRESFGQSQESAVSKTLADTWDYKIVNLPVVIGVFHGFDLASGQLSVAFDEKHTKLETIDLRKIRSVYLLQGSREKLNNYLGGAAAGATGGFAVSFFKNKLERAPNSQLLSKDTARDISIGVGVGLVVSWWRSRGVEDARPWPVYSLDIYQSDPGNSNKVDYKDPHNLEKILPESFIQVMMVGPE